MLLVTGAAGFIGSNVIAALNARGVTDIICIDSMTDGQKCKNLAGKRFADFIDWRDLHENTFPHLSGIIHLGAIANTRCYDGRLLMRANYDFSKRMLELADKMECPIVYASSASVYGDGTSGFREQPEYEMPKSPYAFSKWAFDQYVRRQLETRKVTIPVIGVRYFNVYGPGEAHKGDMASFVYKCFEAIRAGRPLVLFEGSQNILRDFIYVDDAVDITLWLFSKPVSGIYNVGTGRTASFLDVAEAAAAGRADVHMVPFPDDLRDGYQKFTQADLSKLDAAGWHGPALPVEIGIERYRKEFFK